MTNPQVPIDDFEAEILEVQSTLLAATTDLTNPLGDLVRAQIKRSQPPICGAVVLAVSRTSDIKPEDNDLRRKRILLAAALEMLHIALNVHRMLVNAAISEQSAGGEATLDRSFIGSTILAGDYCFSRAAQLAAQTDHPRVVATFSLALQTVSEELLREQFYAEGGPGQYDDTQQLLQSGAQAAAELVALSENKKHEAIALSKELASHWSLHKPRVLPTDGQPFSTRWEQLPESWQTLHQWLTGQRTNGEMPSRSTSPFR